MNGGLQAAPKKERNLYQYAVTSIAWGNVEMKVTASHEEEAQEAIDAMYFRGTIQTYCFLGKVNNN